MASRREDLSGNTSLIVTFSSFTRNACTLLLLPGRGAEHCDQFVCVSVAVCVSVCLSALGERSIAISLFVCLSLCVSVCLSASISLEPLHRSSRNFLYRSPLTVAQSSAGGVAIRYELPRFYG